MPSERLLRGNRSSLRVHFDSPSSPLGPPLEGDSERTRRGLGGWNGGTSKVKTEDKRCQATGCVSAPGRVCCRSIGASPQGGCRSGASVVQSFAPTCLLEVMLRTPSCVPQVPNMAAAHLLPHGPSLVRNEGRGALGAWVCNVGSLPHVPWVRRLSLEGTALSGRALGASHGSAREVLYRRSIGGSRVAGQKSGAGSFGNLAGHGRSRLRV